MKTVILLCPTMILLCASCLMQHENIRRDAPVFNNYDVYSDILESEHKTVTIAEYSAGILDSLINNTTALTPDDNRAAYRELTIDLLVLGRALPPAESGYKELHWLPNDTWEEAKADFLEQNRRRVVLRRLFTINRPYVIVDEQNIPQKQGPLGPNWDWDAFYRRYPNSDGLIWFSRVGYDRVRRYAIVFVAHQRGPRAGIGEHLFMVWRDGDWKVIHRRVVWVS